MDESKLLKDIKNNFNNNSISKCTFCNNEIPQFVWINHVKHCTEIAIEYQKLLGGSNDGISIDLKSVKSILIKDEKENKQTIKNQPTKQKQPTKKQTQSNDKILPNQSNQLVIYKDPKLKEEEEEEFEEEEEEELVKVEKELSKRKRKELEEDEHINKLLKERSETMKETTAKEEEEKKVCFYYGRFSDKCGIDTNRKKDLFPIIIGYGGELIQICKISHHFRNKNFVNSLINKFDEIDEKFERKSSLLLFPDNTAKCNSDECIEKRLSNNTNHLNDCSKFIFFQISKINNNNNNNPKIFFCSQNCLITTFKKKKADYWSNLREAIEKLK